MELKAHFLLQIPVFIALYMLVGVYSAFIVALAHFIPSIDYVMLKSGIKGELHRKLFHNVFVAIIATAIFYSVSGFMAAVLGFLNIMFHFILDLDEHGIAVLYPLSIYRLKWKRK